jgi:hypothetical protein
MKAKEDFKLVVNDKRGDDSEAGDICMRADKRKKGECHPYVSIFINQETLDINNQRNGKNFRCWMLDKDLERFAVNLLKRLKSRKLK